MTIDQRARTSSRGNTTARTGPPVARRGRRVVASALAGVALAGGLVAVQPAAAPAPAAASTSWQPVLPAGTCLQRTGTLVRRVGYQPAQLRLWYTSYATRIDARRASWGGYTNYPVSISGSPFPCISGGAYQGSWAHTTSWDYMHGIAGIRTTNYGTMIEKVRVTNYGDGIRLGPGAQRWNVRSVYLSYLRDDCVENDWQYSGLVTDSLLDGCYNAFSARQYSTQPGRRNGSSDVFTVRDSLVRLQPMLSVYKNRGPVPGHAGFFKWDAYGPKLSLRHNIFRVDQVSSTVGLGIPPGKLADCSDNVVVWLGAGPYPAALPSCFRITRDRTVWDDAVLAWKRAHGYA